jgi:hypothetical protein
MRQRSLVKAQSNLGAMYDFGKGVLKDDKQSAYWYQKAADQGDVEAQYNLGIAYTIGKGVLKDDKQAVYWCQKAADQGYAEAQYKPLPKVYLTPRLDCASAYS